MEDAANSIGYNCIKALNHAYSCPGRHGHACWSGIIFVWEGSCISVQTCMIIDMNDGRLVGVTKKVASCSIVCFALMVKSVGRTIAVQLSVLL